MARICIKINRNAQLATKNPSQVGRGCALLGVIEVYFIEIDSLTAIVAIDAVLVELTVPLIDTVRALILGGYVKFSHALVL